MREASINTRESFWRKVIEDLAPFKTDDSFLTRCVIWLLRPICWGLQWPYRCVMAMRNSAYTSGFFSSSKPPKSYIVSVGNLSVGGSGKTPLTDLLTRHLLELDQAVSRGLSLAILSRGYLSQCDKRDSQLLFRSPSSLQPGILPSSLECGDEPYMLAQRLAGIWFGIGRNRLELSFKLAEKGVNLFILDDGFQHRRLKRDCDIVLLDAEHPFANQQLFPRGPLREPPQSLSRASAVILYPVKDATQFLRSCEQVKTYTQVPIVGMTSIVVGVHLLSEASVWGQNSFIPLSELKGTSVALFCGIARPERFRRSVESLGCSVVSEKFFGDHATPEVQELIRFAEHAATQGARYLLCTEKDAVKWNGPSNPNMPLLPKLALPLLFLRIEMCPVAGEEHWDALVQSIYSGIPF